MDGEIVPRCERCGMEECHEIHMIQKGHDFIPEGSLICSQIGCWEHIQNHAWGRTRSDWFFQKDGRAFCSKHIPDWVREWRARKVSNPYKTR